MQRVILIPAKILHNPKTSEQQQYTVAFMFLRIQKFMLKKIQRFMITAFSLSNKHYRIRITKKTAGIKKEATDYAVDETNASERQPASVVLPDFPLSPSSSSFLLYNRESAIMPTQKRNDGQQWVSNACFVITYKHITNPILSPFLPEQRQKLSAALTQCGMLTSFGSNTPPLKNLSLRAWPAIPWKQLEIAGQARNDKQRH